MTEVIRRLAVALALTVCAVALADLVYHDIPMGWEFAIVALSSVFLFLLGIPRSRQAFRALVLGGPGQDRVWFSLMMLTILVASIARMFTSFMAWSWAIVTGNAELWKDSVPAMWVVAGASFLLLAYLFVLLIKHNLTREEDGFDDNHDNDNSRAEVTVDEGPFESVWTATP